MSEAPMWLSPEGLRYYLPAFLAAAVHEPSIPRNRDVVGFLCPPGRKNRLWSWFRQFVSGLTREQKNVVRECLQHLHVNIVDGAFSYWSGT